MAAGKAAAKGANLRQLVHQAKRLVSIAMNQAILRVNAASARRVVARAA
jgi:hypothetical protein